MAVLPRAGAKAQHGPVDLEVVVGRGLRIDGKTLLAVGGMCRTTRTGAFNAPTTLRGEADPRATRALVGTMANVAKAKGIVTYFDPYDGYGYIVPEGKKSDDAIAFRYDVIDDSQMVQAVRANELVEFDTDDENNPRVATKVARVKSDDAEAKAQPAKKRAAKKTAKADKAAPKKAAAKKPAAAAPKKAAVKKAAAKKAAKRGTTR